MLLKQMVLIVSQYMDIVSKTTTAIKIAVLLLLVVVELVLLLILLESQMLIDCFRDRP